MRKLVVIILLTRINSSPIRSAQSICVSKLVLHSTKNTGEMPSDETSNLIGHAIALGLTGVFVIFVVLYGLIIAQQLLLSLLVALFGIAVYILWLTRN
jgi:hypothetical protein